MAWFKVDDGFHASRKLMSIPRAVRLASAGLWTIAGSWSAHQELDGFVPDYMVAEWGGSQRLVDALVRAGLWEEVPDGTRFSKWGEYQPTRVELEAVRAREAERKRAYRARKSGDSPTGVPAGQTVGHHPESEHPDPTRPDPTPIKETKRVGGSPKRETSPPSPFCSEHPNGTDEPCRGCGNARRRWEASGKPSITAVSKAPADHSCKRDGHKDHPTSPGFCLFCGEQVAA